MLVLLTGDEGRKRRGGEGQAESNQSNIRDTLHSLQQVDCLHDRGPHQHKWRLSAIRALRDSLVVGQVMPNL